MKRLSAIIISLCVFVCFFPSSAFAQNDTVEDLLAKLQALIDETAAEDSAETETQQEGTFSASDLYADTAPKVVEINVADKDGYVFASGSGFFINDRGDLVTNYHVIEDGYSAYVTLADGSQYDVDYVIAYDKLIDLAVLRIGLTGMEYLTTAKEPADTGDTIYTLGSALGLTGTFSDGLVATASRVIDGVDYIQITAPISNGNSGGPLINADGEVLGVNTWGYVEGQNINFAVNINELTNLDYSDPITMRTLYEREFDSSNSASAGIDTDDAALQEWMNDVDYVEAEDNDGFEYADILANDTWMGGNISDIEDFDFYAVILSEPARVQTVILPYYEEDAEYLLTALVDSDGDIISYAEPEQYEEKTFLYLEADIDEAGVYYIVMCVADEYPYSEPAYYQINAEW